jgi:diacylglycerol kinase family enzyme
MKHVFIFESKYFQKQQWKMDAILDSIGQYFRTLTKPDFSTLVSRYPREAIGLIEKQAGETQEDDTMRVYAVGGDEILFDCINGVAEIPNAELAIVPYGKTTDFLRIFKEFKVDLVKDLQSLTSASAIPTDLINAGNNYSLNGCFVGFAAALAAKKRAGDTERKGPAILTPFRRLRNSLGRAIAVFSRRTASRQYTITIDDKDYSGNYSFINVANGPYYDNNKIAAAGAMPDDGLLDVALMKAGGPLTTSLSMGKYSRGKTPSNCFRLKAKKITVHTDDLVWIQLDNEFFQDNNITFEATPMAVQIVAVNNTSYENPNCA